MWTICIFKKLHGRNLYFLTPISDGEQGYDMFTIDSQTGLISTADNIQNGGYNVSLTVQVSDKGNLLIFLYSYS